ncbi:Integral membrane protein CcmA involved in cell shape determination [Caenispirillum salinarum AK4]|uniref:Integral membrane protein CcmA involved in cell shape determination n=1 Tax=Caenispirillum salinarum AK4 TaxID=1238182 RepID=K9GT57_9PROT|nr:polymer-forming cytoskeletal protein [Caenispirillum salinarum]EKV28367.1 Integral membrane protein CcmA involved in cell shape determination [Caenispirillum salinarum AK4]
MFSKAKTPPAHNGRIDTAPTKSVPSIISADLSITGDLVSQGEIQVDGTIEGDIECRSLVIGVNGSVTGEVTADDVRIHGSVSGQVRAKSVYLASTSHMVGDIIHESLAIEPGAFMEGHCRRLQDVSTTTANLRLADDAKDKTDEDKEPAKIA